MLRKVSQLVDKLELIFFDELLSVLLVGSVQKDDTTPFSDIDLVAVIKTFDIKKIVKVRGILKSSEVLVDLSFLCHDEIPQDPDLFMLGSHGAYQLGLILNKAKCVYGRNVLLDFGVPSRKAIQRSLVKKTVEYTWWSRRMFVESNRERSLYSNYQLNSRLIKMVRGFLYLTCGFDIHSSALETMGYFLKKYSDLFTIEEKECLLGLVRKEFISKNTANMSEQYLALRVSVVNKIHKSLQEKLS